MSEEVKTDTQPTEAAPAVPDQAFSAPLYNHDTKEWEETPAHEIASKISSGQYTYQSGIKIPVIGVDGKAYEIDSDNAYNEFKFNGFKPLNSDIQSAWEDRENEKINKSVYGDNPVDAAIAGALRASTLGLSDVVGGAIADKFSPNASEGLAQTKERNPGASLAGEVIGTAATMGTGAAKAATGAIERGTAAALGSGVVGKIAQKAVPAAVEGAYFGLGQGISESALGNPENVVSNIVSNIGAGALFGGAVGTAFGVASAGKPLFDKTLSRLIDGSGDMVAEAARKTGSKGMQAALTAKGEAELAKQIPGYFNLPAEERMWLGRQGLEGAKQVAKDINPLVKEAKSTLAELRTDLTKAVESATDEVRHATNSFVKKAGDDIYEAARISEDAVKHANQQFRDIAGSIGGAEGPYKSIPIMRGVDDVVGKLRAAGDAASIRAANKLEALTSTSRMVTESDQALFFRNMLDTIEPFRGKSNLLDGLYATADEALTQFPNPLVSQAYKTAQTQRLAADALADVADRTVLKRSKAMLGEKAAANGVYDETKAVRTLINPRHREAVEVALNNLEQLAPELKQWQQLQAIKEGSQKITAQVAFQDAVEAKLKSAFPQGKVDVDAVESLFQMIGPVNNVDRQLGKIRELQTVLKADDSAITKMIAVKKALGKEVGEDLQKLATYEKHINLIQDLRQVDMPGYSSAKGVLGGLLGGPLGAVLGAQKTNAGRYVDAIQAVEQIASKGSRQLSKAVTKATEVLTSPKAAKAVKAATYPVDKGPTLKEQRQRFHQVKDSLTHPIKPIASADILPQVSKAIMAKQQQVNDFLLEKAPQDPFTDTRLSLNDTSYMPPDQELSKFFRYVGAVENPIKVVDSIAQGKASPEEVETLKTVWPDIYKTLQESVLDSIIEKKVNLSYQQKVNLSTLLDVPTDPTLRPDFIARMQASINKDEGGRPEGTGGNRKIQIDLKPAETIATAAQNISYKT